MKKLKPENFESFTLISNPKINFVSSSGGISGSFEFVSRKSSIRKDILPSSAYVDATFDSSGINASIQALTFVSSTNIKNAVESYLEKVSSSSISYKENASVPIERYTPGVDLDEYFMRKRHIREVLFPYYSITNPSAQWSYSNFFSLNLLSGSSYPKDFGILYPNTGADKISNIATGSLYPDEGFCIEFFINPRRTQEISSQPYDAGTICHLSSTYSISLISGSSRGADNKTNGFRLQLQLSSSADIKPSLATTGSLVFRTDDNSLSLNSWHHVLINWNRNINNGTGSIYVDSTLSGLFSYEENSIKPNLGTKNPPYFLSIGSYYNGNNNGTSRQSLYFSRLASSRFGVEELDSDNTSDSPANVLFSNPLNAEIQNFSLRKRNYSLEDLKNRIFSSSFSRQDSDFSNTLLNIGPLFQTETPVRTYDGTDGGVLISPFYAETKSTETPFVEDLSFGINVLYQNLENYLQDTKTKNLPRFVSMSFKPQTEYLPIVESKDLFYATSSVRLRNSIISPSDNGNFMPNFEFAGSYESSSGRCLQDYLGCPDPSRVYVGNIITGTVNFTSGTQMEALFQEPLPNDPRGTFKRGPATYRRTGDPSSNEVVLFDISSLYYGTSIKPGSLKIKDNSVTGSNGVYSLTLRDNGIGGLYRADSATKHATWANYGSVCYNEGVVAITSNVLPYFGKDGFEIEFRGTRKTQVSKIDCEVLADNPNKSQNGSYENLIPDENRLEEDSTYVYISSVNIHDDEMDIIMKATLATPIKKHPSDKIVIKLSMDY